MKGLTEADIQTMDLETLYTIAPGYQGGHSAVGGWIADRLCIAFPLDMNPLCKAAKRDGFDPDVLWPWLASMRASRQSQAEKEANEHPETINANDTRWCTSARRLHV